MPYLIDPHLTPASTPCEVGPRLLDAEGGSPVCACGTRLTAEGGIDVSRLVPHELVAGATYHAFASPQHADDDPDLVALGTLVDRWGHTAVVVRRPWGETIVGPSYSAAMRTVCQLVPENHPARQRTRDWLCALWQENASARALQEQHAHARRRAARRNRLAAGRPLLCA